MTQIKIQDEVRKSYYASGALKCETPFKAGKEYDINGNIIHIRWNDVVEAWYDYDSDGNRIHTRYKDGENWYDDKGNIIHRKWKEGYEEWYDDKGKIIHNIDIDGHEYWFEYDSNGTRSIRRV